MKKLYVITGAIGHLGYAITKIIEKEECLIRGLILPSETAENHGNVTYYKGDIREKETLLPLFEDTDGMEVVVIHCAAIISLLEEVTPLIYDVNVRGTENIISLCLEKKVARLVYVSSVDAIPVNNPLTVVSEVSSFSADRVVGGYGKTKAEASQAVLGAVKEGLNAVVVHPSAILGPFDMLGTNNVVNKVKEYMEGKMPAYIEGNFDFVDVRDVALGCLLAAEKGRNGDCYNLTNRGYTFKEFLDVIRAINGGGKRIPKLPLWLVMALVPLVEWQAKKKNTPPMFTKYALRKLTFNSRFSHDKATRDLGYMPRDFYATMQDTIAWIKKQRV